MARSATPVRPILSRMREQEALSLHAHLPELRSLIPGALVGIVGGHRSGKTVCARMLRGLVDRTRICVLDEPPIEQVARSLQMGAVVYAACAPFPLNHVACYRLMPWGPDQWIEFLLANHKDACAPVMARLRAGSSAERLEGRPELWTLALSAMAADPGLHDPVAALRVPVARGGKHARHLKRAYPLCRALGESSDIVRAVLAGKPDALPRHAGVHVIAELVEALKTPAFAEGIERAAADAAAVSHAVPVSVLHLAGRAWRPHVGASVRIPRAVVPGLNWPGVAMRLLDARSATLHGADLEEASIEQLDVAGARLVGARLRGVRAASSDFRSASLAHADLSACVLHAATLQHADLTGARAERADLTLAELDFATLRASRFSRADLRGASFQRTQLGDADLSGCNLGGAKFEHVDFREAQLHGARLVGAALTACVLDEVYAQALDLQRATLANCDLTGSVFPHAMLEAAQLISCGLAGINWEDTNLRGAGFSGSTFHAGTSRSGLVGSTIASEGTRTGFYSDDYRELSHRSPEAIRKANLCGADLRGAAIEGVDFYLVDLRRARYDNTQAQWLRRCGAILFDPRP